MSTNHLPTRAALYLLIALPGSLAAAQAELLALESTIVLEHVSGRIDHLAIDLLRHRLFVAELGNDSVGVVDLNTRQVLRTITGLPEPQGLAYLPSTDTLYVACGGDGSVRLLQGADLRDAGRIELGADADNIRVDLAKQRVYVGHGSGGIAVIDAASGKPLSDIALHAHPESFQQDPVLRRIYANVPDRSEIAVIDLASGRQTLNWHTGALNSNFPMTLSATGNEVWVGFRHPAVVAEFNTQTGVQTRSAEVCADADDIFLDTKRSQLYVSCGAGELDVLAWQAGPIQVRLRVPTRPGARTSLLVPELDRLYVAAPARIGRAAVIFVYRLGTT